MEWNPSLFFRPEGSPSPYALLILNQPINEKAFEVLNEYASYIICADGGANRLYDLTKSQGKESIILPNTIVGDLDSLNLKIRQHYEDLGVTILEDPDQYSTDFTKCLKHLNTHSSEIIASPRKQRKDSTSGSKWAPDSVLEIVILGGLGGRVDQAFSQIHHLYMMTRAQRELRETPQYQDQDQQGYKKPSAAGGNLYLVSEESITFVLQQGKNIIYTPGTRRPDIAQAALDTGSQPENSSEATLKRKRDVEGTEYFFEENIGIIPLSAPASITTQGFEWDVQDWHTEIGGQLSTSNHIRAEKVEIETSVSVLFTVELAQRLKR
ncbi:thiamine pyrophosphokinase eukaryotic [Penicillium malachiteum]|uniref:thiamine pyrophosphokinase eukaryotic n=1 Tax=Penicillium malachiteum TaxID=1324776 RepID=UPI002547C2C7|nr:thiamine pyrophosphokinase eukaryotic [Penicillium malachiteum]KAJ5716003.1 thiamine pyrophosphokinase eukaryotic [Penicillium malachiteum]